MRCFPMIRYSLCFSLFILFLTGSPDEILAEGEFPTERQTTEPAASVSSKNQDTETAEAPLPVLPQVTVIGAVIPPDPGQVELTPELIKQLPAADGSLNELLRVLPGIQTSEAFRTSARGGEILPPPISISGGKVYENNFLIDGFSNNSLLDPTFNSSSDIQNVPDHPQTLFLNPELLEEVIVLRSNASARYGRFTGGVVDARTRNPAAMVGIRTAYRTTRSEWTRFHIDNESKEEFENSTSEENQPKFRKHEASLTLDLPLTEKMGLLAHYSLLYSRISLDHLGDSNVQKRTLENLFLKALVRPNGDMEWATDFTWTPYESDLFLKDTRNSNYVVEGGGYAIKTRLNTKCSLGVLEMVGGYGKNFNRRYAPQDWFYWRTLPSGFSKVGGHGDVDKEQETVSLETHFTSEPLHTWRLSHVLATGGQYEQVKGTFDRTEPTTRYNNATLNEKVVCEPGDISCITGEQFMVYKLVYAEDAADASITFTDFYLEDKMSLGRFSLRPGVRLSKDDLLDNTDFAPRLAANLDLFGNGQTILMAGINRYYGKTLLTHALAEEKKPNEVWTRPGALGPDGRPQPWTIRPRSTIAKTRMANLDTPYNDEITAGINQTFLGGDLQLLFIKRWGRKELTKALRTETVYVYNEWTNEGKSRHREYSMAWERRWRRHHLLLNATWQETETSHLNYDDFFEGDELEDPVWFDGKVIDSSDLPAPDYNREWTGNLVYGTILPYGFSFSNVTRYRSGYRALVDTRNNKALDDGRELDIYKEVKHPESWVFDWKLNWQSPAARLGNMLLSLEVLNVFNEKTRSGVDAVAYEIGRQFWAGAEWNF